MRYVVLWIMNLFFFQTFCEIIIGKKRTLFLIDVHISIKLSNLQHFSMLDIVCFFYFFAMVSETDTPLFKNWSFKGHMHPSQHMLDICLFPAGPCKFFFSVSVGIFKVYVLIEGMPHGLDLNLTSNPNYVESLLPKWYTRYTPTLD